MNDIPKRARPHQVYHLRSGQTVPGVTTVLGIINKGGSALAWGMLDRINALKEAMLVRRRTA